MLWLWLDVLQAWGETAEKAEEHFVERYVAYRQFMAEQSQNASILDLASYGQLPNEMRLWADNTMTNFAKSKLDINKPKQLFFIPFARVAARRSEVRSVEVEKLLPAGFEHRDFWLNEMHALEAANAPIAIERNAIEFPNGDTKIKRSPGYSVTVFLNKSEAGHDEVIREIGAIQSRIQSLFPEQTLLVPAEGLHVTIKGIKHGIQEELSEPLMQTYAETLRRQHSAKNAARGKLVGPVWHRSLGVVMIFVPSGEDILSAVKAETEADLNLSREARPFHMTLAYLPQSKLLPEQIRQVQEKINSIPLQAIPVEFKTAEVNGYEDVAFTKVLRDQKTHIPLARSEVRFEHDAIRYGKKLDNIVTQISNNLVAEVYEFNGVDYLLVKAANPRESTKGRLSFQFKELHSKTESFYILRDRFPAFEALNKGEPFPSENDPTYIRAQGEMKNLVIDLKPGQIHFFEITPSSSEIVSAFHQVLGLKATEYTALGAFNGIRLNKESRVLRMSEDGHLIEMPVTQGDAPFNLVDEPTGLRFYTGSQIADLFKSNPNYAGEWQIYNPRGGKLRVRVTFEGKSEVLEVAERGAILIKDLAPGVKIEWEDFTGAEFVVVADRDPAWFKPITHPDFDQMRSQIVKENSGIRSSDWMQNLGVIGIGLSRKQNFKVDALENRVATPWAIHAFTEFHIRSRETFATSGGSLIQETGRGQSVTATKDYSTMYFPKEQIHSHKSDLPGAKAMELYYVAEGAVGFYVNVNGHESFLKLKAGDVLIIDPHVIHGIMYVNLPYAHVAVQAPSVWAMALLGFMFKQFLGTTEDWIKSNPQKAAQMVYLMQSAPSGNYAMGDNFGTERGGKGLERQKRAFDELKNLFEKEFRTDVNLANPPKALRSFFENLAVKPKAEIEEVYGTARIQALMTMVLLLAPSVFEKTENWDPDFSIFLKGFKQSGRQDLFNAGNLTKTNTKSSFAKVFTLTHGDQKLVIPFFFGLFADPQHAEYVIRNKIWTGRIDLPLGLKAGKKYTLTDLLAITKGGKPAVYGDQFIASDLQKGREFGIPVLQGEDKDAEQPTLYPYAFFQILEIKETSARSEVRVGVDMTPAERLVTMNFAAGFFPLGVTLALRMAGPEAVTRAIASVIPQDEQNRNSLAAQRMLGLTVGPQDAFVLGKDLAIQHRFLAAVKKVFPGTAFAVIADGSEKEEIEDWIQEQGLADVLVVAESAQRARAELQKRNPKAVIRGLALAASTEADELGRELPMVTFTSGQLDRMMSFAVEAARLVEFSKAFATAA